MRDNEAIIKITSELDKLIVDYMKQLLDLDAPVGILSSLLYTREHLQTTVMNLTTPIDESRVQHHILGCSPRAIYNTDTILGNTSQNSPSEAE